MVQCTIFSHHELPDSRVLILCRTTRSWSPTTASSLYQRCSILISRMASLAAPWRRPTVAAKWLQVDRNGGLFSFIISDRIKIASEKFTRPFRLPCVTSLALGSRGPALRHSHGKRETEVRSSSNIFFHFRECPLLSLPLALTRAMPSRARDDSFVFTDHDNHVSYVLHSRFTPPY